MKQEYTSKETSINVVNKVYKQYDFKPNSLILDYGGGKYDSNIEYMKNKNCTVLVYDKYNRTEEHNNRALQDSIDVDYIVCSNVLNVIKEEIILEEIVQNIYNISIDTTICLFTVYEGDKSGIGKVTTKGYQRNEKMIEYTELLGKYFKIEKKKGVYICERK